MCGVSVSVICISSDGEGVWNTRSGELIALLCLRSRDGGGLGTRNRAPDDLGRREDNPDLGHGSGNESTGNTCLLVPAPSPSRSTSHGPSAPKRLSPLCEELPGPGAPAALPPAPGSRSKINKTTQILGEHVRALLEAAVLFWVCSNAWGR